MIVKVCGMRDAENIREVDALGVDLMGFIFYEKSPRFVSEVPSYLPKAERVGVFVNTVTDEILEKAEEFGLQYVQLHGSEGPEFCKALKDKGLKVIKAFSIASDSDLRSCAAYDGSCDLLLFDTKCNGYGGSGQQFDWSILNGYDGETPFLLSGGLGPDSDIAGFSHPKLAGYDLNSRFEVVPALKSTAALQIFIEKIKRQ